MQTARDLMDAGVINAAKSPCLRPTGWLGVLAFLPRYRSRSTSISLNKYASKKSPTELSVVPAEFAEQ